jgi:lambda family phage portal protein
MKGGENLNWFDRAISFLSPSWAYKRTMYREAQRGYYDSAGTGRLNSSWTTHNSKAEQTDQPYRDIIRARSRDLERNSDIAEAIIAPFERNVVGTGIRLQSKILDASGKEDEKLNTQVEELFKEWCKARNCDVSGQQSFIEMQQMAIRRLKIDGGVIFIKIYNNVGPVPLSLQVLEVDDIDTSVNENPGYNKRVVHGIEYDEYNKPTAYYFKKYTPDGYYVGKNIKIEADRVIFLWQKTRPSQIREISPMAKTISRVKDSNEYIEAVSVKERVLACLSVFITKSGNNGPGRGVTQEDKSSYNQQTLSPGMIHYLNPGESINAVSPSGQSSNARDFIGIQQRLAGAGQGLSYEAISRDMSQVNYSSARQGMLEDQRTYSMLQQFLIEHFCQEVYTDFFISAVLSKKIIVKNFWDNKQQYLRHEWIQPGWSWIDPLKEVNANKFALETGQETLANICASKGMDWRDVMSQRAKEKEFAKELGLDLVEGVKNSAKETSTSNGNTAGKTNS